MPDTISHMEVVSDSSEAIDASDGSLSETVNTGLTLDEGEALPLSNAQLEVDSVDTLPTDIIFTVTGSNPELEIFNNGELTDTFSQHDINEGRVTFAHTGVEPSSDGPWLLTLEFAVTNDNGDTLPVTFEVNVNSVDDAPVLILSEDIAVMPGESVLVTLDNINATDVDSSNSQLVFKVESLTQGRFLNDGVETDTFSKQDIVDGIITFSQSGTAPVTDYTINILVEDDTNPGISQALQVRVTAAPTFGPIGTFVVDEGGTLSINNTLLNVVDADTDATQVVFTVLATTEGVIEVGGQATDTFTLAQLDSSEGVIFRHSNSEPSLGATLQLAVSDGQTSVEIPVIDISVTGVNDEAPVAIDHAASGKHQETITTLSNNEPSVLFGLTDADEGPDTHTVEVIEMPSVGSLVLNSDGTFEYTPSDEQIDVGYQDTFTYQIADSADNLSNIATVTLNVEALLAPEAQEQMADLQSTELAPFSAVISETLFSSPEDATPLSYSVVAQSGDLPAWLSFDGPTRNLTGTPQDADTGTVALGVFATDTNGLQSDTLSFNLVVQDINQAPTIDSVALSPVTENSVEATVGTVQASDPDASDTLSYSVSDNRFEFDGNTLKLAADTSLDFEQASSVDMVVTVTDQQGANDSLDVTVVVEDLNDEAPVAIDHAASGKHQEMITTLSNNEPSVLFGLTDADEGPDTHTVEVIEMPSVGSLVLNSDGTFEYTPSDEQIEVGYQDTFTYQIADSAGNLSNIATVTLNVEALLAPEAQEQMADLQSTELAPFSAVISETLFSSPEDATPLSYSVVAQSGDLPAWLSFDGPTCT